MQAAQKYWFRYWSKIFVGVISILVCLVALLWHRGMLALKLWRLLLQCESSGKCDDGFMLARCDGDLHLLMLAFTYWRGCGGGGCGGDAFQVGWDSVGGSVPSHAVWMLMTESLCPKRGCYHWLSTAVSFFYFFFYLYRRIERCESSLFCGFCPRKEGRQERTGWQLKSTNLRFGLKKVVHV